jgi:hypothetical protein
VLFLAASNQREEASLLLKKGPDQSEEKQVYDREDLGKQIRRLDHEISVACKQHGKDCDKNEPWLENARSDWTKARCDFSNNKYSDCEDNISNCNENLIEAVNRLDHRWKFQYYASLWGALPITIGVLGIVISLVLIAQYGTAPPLLKIVPLWAIWVASLGASCQILVGVVKDYKEDSLISEYRRTWYIVVIFVSLAFGFLAFLLLQMGLITISQGQFMINPTNVTATVNATTTTTTPTVSTTYAGSLALPALVCFLAGYATEWFMSLIGKITSP